jgi:hypothetical protein
LVGRLVDGPEGLGEMGAVHAGGEAVDVGVQVLLRLIERAAAGEDHVGLLDQAALQLGKVGAGEAEGRKLVHAVIGDGLPGDLRGPGTHHGV